MTLPVTVPSGSLCLLDAAASLLHSAANRWAGGGNGQMGRWGGGTVRTGVGANRGLRFQISDFRFKKSIHAEANVHQDAFPLDLQDDRGVKLDRVQRRAEKIQTDDGGSIDRMDHIAGR